MGACPVLTESSTGACSGRLFRRASSRYGGTPSSAPRQLVEGSGPQVYDRGLMTQPSNRVVGALRERRVEVAPGVALHVELREGEPSAVPFVLVHGLAATV